MPSCGVDVVYSGTHIVEKQFKDCSDLETFIGDDVTTIQEEAFEDAKNLIAFYGLKVTTIEEDAFEDCDKLDILFIPQYTRNLDDEDTGITNSKKPKYIVGSDSGTAELCTENAVCADGVTPCLQLLSDSSDKTCTPMSGEKCSVSSYFGPSSTMCSDDDKIVSDTALCSSTPCNGDDAGTCCVDPPPPQKCGESSITCPHGYSRREDKF
jgi:hypothetical protein